MNREDILRISREEHKNQDLPDLELSAQAGNIAGRVGACVCCLVSLICHRATGLLLLSPWIIYFSILGTHYFVKYRKGARRSDLPLAVLYFIMGLIAAVFFILRLLGAWE